MRESKVPRYIILIILGIMAIGLGIKGISDIIKYNSEWERFKTTAVSTEVSTEKPTRKRTTKVAIDYEVIRDQALYRRLLDWRKGVSAEKHLPASYIMPIRTIIGIANTRPLTKEDLLAIPGIGDKTIQDYGAELLEIVRVEN